MASRVADGNSGIRSQAMTKTVCLTPAKLTRRGLFKASLAAAMLPASIKEISAATGGSLRIGVALGLTGAYAEPSGMQKRGYELWRDEVNARGGILGLPVEMNIRDDRSNTEESRSIYRDFLSSRAVDHVFGPYSSEITSGIAPIVDSANYPMLAAGASADEIWQRGYRGIFGMWTPASRYTQGMLRLARENGLSTVALISADDTFSKEVAAGTMRWAPYLKLAVVYQQEFAKSSSDLLPAMRLAKPAGSATGSPSRMKAWSSRSRAASSTDPAPFAFAVRARLARIASF